MFYTSLEKKIIKEERLMLDNSKNITVTDEVLMQKTLEGDKKAFYLLVNRWNKQIFNFFYKNTQDLTLSEDLAQEVFINVWKTKSYNPKAPFYSWLYRIAKNKLIDYGRKKRIKFVSVEDNPEVFEIESESHKSFSDSLIEEEQEVVIKKAISELSEEQRTIIILSKFQKLPYEDIAKIMNCSNEAVKVKVFRTIKILAKRFKELYGDK